MDHREKLIHDAVLAAEAQWLDAMNSYNRYPEVLPTPRVQSVMYGDWHDEASPSEMREVIKQISTSHFWNSGYKDTIDAIESAMALVDQLDGR